MYGHMYSKSMDQPGKVANPARGQLNRENAIAIKTYQVYIYTEHPSKILMIFLYRAINKCTESVASIVLFPRLGLSQRA